MALGHNPGEEDSKAGREYRGSDDDGGKPGYTERGEKQRVASGLSRELKGDDDRRSGYSRCRRACVSSRP